MLTGSAIEKRAPDEHPTLIKESPTFTTDGMNGLVESTKTHENSFRSKKSLFQQETVDESQTLKVISLEMDKSNL